MDSKLLLLIVAYVAIDSATCASFYCPKSNPCILLHLNATLHMKRFGAKNETAAIDISSARVVDHECICHNETPFESEPIIMLEMFPTAERLRFMFPSFPGNATEKKKNDNIYMGAVFDFVPSKHFSDDPNNKTIEIPAPPTINIGSNSNSYVCNSAEVMNFDQAPYHIALEISDLHVQAYDVRSGHFSPAIECRADFTSESPVTTPNSSSHETTEMTSEPTSPKTTEPAHTTVHQTTTPAEQNTTSHMTSETTEPMTTNPGTTETTNTKTTHHVTSQITTETSPAIPNITTTEPSNITTMTTETSKMTTITTEPVTSPVSPIVTTPVAILPTYGLQDPDGQYFCVVFRGLLQLEITYNQTDDKQAIFKTDIPRNATVTGSCSVNGTNSSQEITLSFFDGWKLSVSIGLESGYTDSLENVDAFSWEEVTLQYVVDDHFDKPKNKGKTFTSSAKPDFGTFKSSIKGSYMCQAFQQVAIQELKLDLQEFQYLAFGESDTEDFPKTGVTECPQDTKTTVAPSTTAAPGHNQAGAIVGGVIGGIALVVIVLGGVMYYRKRKQRENMYDEL